MSCGYRKNVAGDCHISCTRKFGNEEYTPEFSNALRNLPNHAGSFPYLFNAGFVCCFCPAKDEQRDVSKVAEPDKLMAILAMLR
jgi:hypothetical protein